MYPTILDRPQVVEIPNKIFDIADQIPTINGRETLQGTVNLWLELFKLPKPFPSFKRFIPGIYAYWNSVKGGSDTTTKLMDDCVLRVPRNHLNSETAAIARLIMLLLATFHRLLQVINANPENDYPSLAHYRNAASHRTSFHFSILQCHLAFKNALEQHQNPAPPNNALQPINQNAAELRRNPNRRRVANVVPEETNFGAVLHMATPKKMNYHLKQGVALTPVKEMVRKCEGIPMKTHPRKTCKCCVCGSNTAWFCAGCKRWFCMERRDTERNGKRLQLYAHTIGGKVQTFQKACFHEGHEQRWRTNNVDLDFGFDDE